MFIVLALFSLSLTAIASDSVECDNKQVIGYDMNINLVESGKSKVLYLTSGSARKIYLRLKVAAVDSRTLGTIQQDVTGHYTKKTNGVTCFKQEVETEACATYSCNIQVKAD